MNQLVYRERTHATLTTQVLVTDMRHQERYRGRSALVTGASSGLGRELAQALAARGMSVLLTALPSDQERLRALGDDLASQYDVRTECVAVDLVEPGAAAHLQATADALGFEPDLLVNCAGLGSVGAFHELPLDRQLLTLRVNIAALVELTGRYVPRMVARGDGTVLNVASTAAFQPMPYFAVYAASKAFVLSFSEALWAELRHHGVRVVAVCPGPMSGTAFHAGAGDATHQSGVHGLLTRRHLHPSAVAASALRAAERGQPTVVVRVPIAGAVYEVVERLTSIVVPRRYRLAAGERTARWLLHVE
jgi:uncharacterized protein